MKSFVKCLPRLVRAPITGLTVLVIICFVGVTSFATTIKVGDGINDPIVKIQSSQSCNVIGLATSPATSTGGVHCNTGNTPFSLKGILDGTIMLFVGNSTTPSWNVVNDTGATLLSLTLYYSGALASNANLNLQVSGTSLFNACQITENGGVVTSGCSQNTGSPVLLPAQFTWSGGTGVAAGGTFNIGTASFAHAGQDAGCISGTNNCMPLPPPVPEPEASSLLLMGMGLVAGTGVLRRQTAARFRDIAVKLLGVDPLQVRG